ncbi:MAG: hypothetical protein ACE5G1_01135 [bacterium]
MRLLPHNQTVTATAMDHKLELKKRSQLLAAISALESGSEPNARRRVALAEAEFRLAILPGTELPDAIKRIQKAIKHDPFHPKYFFHLARFLYQSGEHLNAVREYRQALKLAPASHRTYVHLALALLELGETEKKIGRDILTALSRGTEHRLSQYLAKLDELLKTQFTEGKKSQSANKRDVKESKDTDNQQPIVPCRWNGVWRLSLVEQLSRLKPIRKEIDKHLDFGAQAVDGQAGVTEYSTACLLLLIDGEPPKFIEKMLQDQKFQSHAEHPAITLVHSTLALIECEESGQFVERAVDILQAGDLPLEVVCYLHYSNYGPDSSLSIEEALNVLNMYPQNIQESDCFRELRLAVFDGYARKAWSDERFYHARLLWRETIPLDPNRIAVSHNLALAAARTKSHVDYGPTWNRAAELRYLHAAAAGDVQVMLEDRRTMHLAFAQQSKQRYCGSIKTPEQPPKEEELERWVADKDALDVWLREWDLYYLNSRLRFRSPVHLLGVARDASQEMTSDAYKALLRQIDTSLRYQPWVGMKTFCKLAEEYVNDGFERACDLVERARDPHYEQEKPDADMLAKETVDRGFLLHRLITVMVDKTTASNIPVGCTIARHLFALPWEILQPICAERGMIERNLDLVKVFESHFLALATADKSEPKTNQEALDRLSAIDECLTILPHRVELHLVRCQTLINAQKNADAYSSAIDALNLIANIEDREEAEIIKKNLTIIVDNAAFAELPEHLRKPSSLEEAKRTLREGRKVLKRFPRAGGLRTFLANIMTQIGDKKSTKEAADLLEEGIRLSLSDEQTQEFQKLLEKAGVQSQVAEVFEEIKTLLEGASKRVSKVVQEINRRATGESLRKGREAVKTAIRDAERAKELAKKAELEDAESQAEDLVRQFKEIQKRL